MTGLIVRTDLAPASDSISAPLRPRVQGQGHDAHRASRHRADDPQGHGHRSRRARPPRTSGSPPWTRSRRRPTPARSASSPATTTSATLSPATPAIALGWSGDAVQLQKDNPNIKFIMPKEGCMLWSTSMEIPIGAPHPGGGPQAFIDFVYDPEVQADIAEYVNYVTPVTGVKEILGERDPALAQKIAHLPVRELHGELHVRAAARREAGRGRHGGLRTSLRSRCGTLSIVALQTSSVSRDPAATLRASRARPPRRVRARSPDAQLVLLPELHLPAPPRLLEDPHGGPADRAVEVPGPLTDSLGASSPPTRPVARARLALRTRRGRAGSTTPRRRSHPTANWSRATARSSPGSRTRDFLSRRLLRHLRHPGRRPDRPVRSVTTAKLPETYRQLAWMGAEVVLQPALTTTSDRNPSSLDARANAIFNQLYAVSAQRGGAGRARAQPRRRSRGTRARSRRAPGDEMLTDVLDLDAVTRVREFGTAGVSRMWDPDRHARPRAGPAADVPGRQDPPAQRGIDSGPMTVMRAWAPLSGPARSSASSASTPNRVAGSWC